MSNTQLVSLSLRLRHDLWFSIYRIYHVFFVRFSAKYDIFIYTNSGLKPWLFQVFPIKKRKLQAICPRTSRSCPGALPCAGGPRSATRPDLDRTIVFPPRFVGVPQYCSLDFGSKAMAENLLFSGIRLSPKTLS